MALQKLTTTKVITVSHCSLVKLAMLESSDSKSSKWFYFPNLLSLNFHNISVSEKKKQNSWNNFPRNYSLNCQHERVALSWVSEEDHKILGLVVSMLGTRFTRPCSGAASLRLNDHIYRMVKESNSNIQHCIWTIRTHYIFVSTNDYKCRILTAAAWYRGLQLLPFYIWSLGSSVGEQMMRVIREIICQLCLDHRHVNISWQQWSEQTAPVAVKLLLATIMTNTEHM